MLNKETRRILKLNRQILDMLGSGKVPEIGEIAGERMFITVNGRDALVFAKADCIINIPKIIDTMATTTYYRRPLLNAPNKDEWTLTLAELDEEFKEDRVTIR